MLVNPIEVIMNKIFVVGSRFRTPPWLHALYKNFEIFLLAPQPYDIKVYNQLNLKNKICDLTDLHFFKSKTKYSKFENNLKKIEAFENKYNTCLSKIINSDRTLRIQTFNIQVSYVAFIIDQIDDLFNKVKPLFIVLEPTFTCERIISVIAEKLNIPTLHPHSDRFLSNRFFLFKGMDVSTPFVRKNKNPNYKNDAIDIYNSIISGGKPRNYYENALRSKFNFKKFETLYLLIKWYFFDKYKPNRLMNGSFSYLIKNKFLMFCRANCLRYILKSYFSIPFKKRYILFPLHLQPERSIDVAAEKFSDQLFLIKTLRLSIPLDITLAIKEHPHCVGVRDLSFYKNINKLSNVCILPIDYDMTRAIKEAIAVVSPAGTACIEAAINNIPTMTLKRVYFEKLIDVIPNHYDIDDLSKCFKKLINSKKSFSKKEIITKIESFTVNMFDGDIFDVLRKPNVMDKKNIDKISSAFKDVSFKLSR